MTPTATSKMLNDTSKWSHARGNEVVPCSWQATVLGTRTKKDTVNAALAQVVALNARRQFLDDARRGDLADAADESVTDQAWRR